MSTTVTPSNNKDTATSFDDLPQETAAEILTRLPVKDLIRSTSVNKTWYSLINNPSFISQQISRCISHCHDNAVLIIPPFISHQNYCSLISADTSSVIETFHIPFVTKSRSLKLIAQVHGMLLLTDLHMDYAYRELYLWNPYVKRHRVLVSTCFTKLLDNRKKSYYIVGMGFDNITNDYKVVRIVYVGDDKGRQFGEVAPKVELYSFRKNTWRKIKDPRVPRLAREEGTYVNGSYYWVEMKQPGTEEFYTFKSRELKIMSFDFGTELFGEFRVPSPVPRLFGVVAPFRLMVYQGSLVLCTLDPDRCIADPAKYPYRVWIMRQENGVVSWMLCLFAILGVHGPPLNLTKTGTLIIEARWSELGDVTSIYSCNLMSKVCKDHGFGKHGGPEVSRAVLGPSTVDTYFPESLIMYEGGKSLLKYAK